jgi:hypothetical protein
MLKFQECPLGQSLPAVVDGEGGEPLPLQVGRDERGGIAVLLDNQDQTLIESRHIGSTRLALRSFCLLRLNTLKI